MRAQIRVANDGDVRLEVESATETEADLLHLLRHQLSGRGLYLYSSGLGADLTLQIAAKPAAPLRVERRYVPPSRPGVGEVTVTLQGEDKVPGNQVFITDADLYNRIGGQAAFAQLIDPAKTGKLNSTISLLARTDACAVVLEAAGVQADLEGHTVAAFVDAYPNLVAWASYKAIALAWTYASGGQAMPTSVQRIEDLANWGLEQLATRRKYGNAPQSSAAPAPQPGAPQSIAVPAGAGSYAAPRCGVCHACLGKTAQAACEGELVASREAVRRLWCHVQAVNPAGLDRQSALVFAELRREVEALARVAGVA